ncbi:MAG: M28 family peptidase [Sphingorhabdus sp.]
MTSRLLLTLSATLIALTPALARPVSEAALRKHIQVLASDEFEGREPGTEGERRTLAYLENVWSKAGLKPGAADGGWYQPVQLVRRAPKDAKVQFFANGQKIRIASDELLLVGKEASYTHVRLPTIFAGYGVDAKGDVTADVRGKLVFLLSDSADFLPAELRQSRARREKLMAAGAEGVITVSGEQFDYPVYRRALMARPIIWAGKDLRAPLEGVAGRQYMIALVTAAGGDWDKMRVAAKSPDYAGQTLGLTVDLAVDSDVTRFASPNIIGKLPGRKPNSGAVVFMGHWDHLGICRPEGEVDRICNGAVDNASGMAVLTEIARELSRKRHDRDIYFVGTTAEESGLWGAYAFAADPVVPLDRIKIVLNIDTIAVAPRGTKVAIIGRGKTDLDSDIEAVIKKARRKVEPSNDANAFLQRQDGWALTQKGVPAFMIGSAFADMGKADAFLKGVYHGPDDEVNASLQLGGAAEDADLHIALAEYFASLRKYPGKAKDEASNNGTGNKGTGE